MPLIMFVSSSFNTYVNLPKKEINKLKSVAFEAHSNYNFQTQESINILETKAKRNYDYDFLSNNANSYELWMKRRHEIKQKRILAKTIN
jgi:hypothetical protein